MSELVKSLDALIEEDLARGELERKGESKAEAPEEFPLAPDGEGKPPGEFSSAAPQLPGPRASPSHWLITVRAVPTQVDFSGNLYVGSPIIQTILIDEHPAKYLVEGRKAHEELIKMKPLNVRADREEILWATPLPEGTLTEEEELLLI